PSRPDKSRAPVRKSPSLSLPKDQFHASYSDRHSGARRCREPGIHIPEARVHGFRASPAGRSRNDMLDEWAQSSGSIAAGYVDRDAGHKIRIARRQKADDPGLVRRLGDPAQRRAIDLGLLVFRARLVPARPYALGQGAARRDRIDVDVIGPE